MADADSNPFVAVADASFLIGLGFLNRLALLEVMAERVYVADAVWKEVVTQGQERAGAQT